MKLFYRQPIVFSSSNGLSRYIRTFVFTIACTFTFMDATNRIQYKLMNIIDLHLLTIYLS